MHLNAFDVLRFNYNAGQKKRNSELRIFGAPPEGGGSTLKTVQHTTFKVGLPLPGNSQKIHGSELRFFLPALYYKAE